jgi:Fic family protein
MTDIATLVADIKADMETVKKAVLDRNENVTQMEPLVLSADSRHRAALTDIAVDLAARSAGFRRSLPSGIHTALADLVRSMNCYYSNLIEGHDTHPIDIERALNDDYSADPVKRNLQHEAKAHIEVQRWIDDGGLRGIAVTQDGLKETHRRFCEHLPDEMLWVEDPATKKRIRVVPGELRERDVKVGHHVPISPGAVPRFLTRFETVYGNLGKTEAILAAAAAHHRFVWIHPFLDGNGRVARLMSHAMLLESLDTGGVWSVARGFGRNVAAYKGHLAACDMTRRNDLDGRGNLSEEALADFTRFFLETCVDQVSYMEGLMDPSRLRARILLWTQEEIRVNALPQKTGDILEAVLYRGELPRAELPELLDVDDRQARRITSALADRGVLTSESTRAPLRLAFPATLASRWMPGLFPDRNLTTAKSS